MSAIRKTVSEIDGVPEPLSGEVIDFVQWLKQKLVQGSLQTISRAVTAVVAILRGKGAA